EQGYSKQGSVRTTTLKALGLSVHAISLSLLTLVKGGSTEILVGVECLKAWQSACTADSRGNVGTGNKGKDNFGDNNVGDYNIGMLEGNSNKGNYNWGDNNAGSRLRCNNAVGIRMVLNFCSLSELRKYAFKTYNPPSPPPKRSSPPPTKK
ncbi:hypothetical protein APUTEX25_001490, partial [Auxenochlorella protothecoides]